MAIAEKYRFAFYLFNLGNNKIGNEGCKFLSKSDWLCMKKLIL